MDVYIEFYKNNDKERKSIDRIITKAIKHMENVEVRKKTIEEIAKLSLYATPELFNKLIIKLKEFPDGIAGLRKSWKSILNNILDCTGLISSLGEDEKIRSELVQNPEYLFDYCYYKNIAQVAEELSKLEGGNEAVASEFSRIIEDCVIDFDKVCKISLRTEKGKEALKENFKKIKEYAPIEEFFNIIIDLKGIEEFKQEYEEYIFWAELYKEIKADIEAKNFESEKSDYSKEIVINRMNSEFKYIINSPDKEEKELILKEISKGERFKYEGVGNYSLVLRVRNQIAKLSYMRRRFKIPYHKRLLMPTFRKEYKDGSCLEIFNYANAVSAEITDEKLLDIFKELESSGIIWGDAKKDNLVVLLKDNTLPDYIVSKEFNVFGFVEDARYPTEEHEALKAGDIVISDLDMIYSADDPNIEYGPIDDVIAEYLQDKKYKDMAYWVMEKKKQENEGPCI